MDEVFILIKEEEDYRTIYGIFTTIIEAMTQKNMLKKYNEYCNYGELKIYRYNLNEVYTNNKPDDCT